MSIIEQMLSKYTIKSSNDLLNALKEVFQEIILLGLYRGGFFEKSVFYGGTALRILYGLDRFSEDLDFSLIDKEDNFEIEKYFPSITNEFNALGIDIIITKKNKKNENNIESAFLKSESLQHSLNIDLPNLNSLFGNIYDLKMIKIKLEVDINPPLNFQTEVKTMLLPTTFNIVSMTIPNLYARKLHAVLFRNWKNRVKGRDWYDFEWYVKNNYKINLSHLNERMIASKNWEKEKLFDYSEFKNLMLNKIEVLDIESAKKEVKPFIKNSEILNFWNKDYFRLLVDKIKVEDFK